MATTLTLDDDVAENIKRYMSTSGQSFEDTVYQLIRIGLDTARTEEGGAVRG